MVTKTCPLYDVLFVAVFKHTLSGDKFDEDQSHNYSFLIVFLVDCLVNCVPNELFEIVHERSRCHVVFHGQSLR